MSTTIGHLIALQQRLNTTAAVFQEALAGRLGLSIKELYTLAILFDTSTISTGELAECLSITPAAVTKITDRLVARGHVTRIADENDRRRVLIALDHVDTEEISTAAEHYITRLAQLANDFSAEERIVIARYLDGATTLMRENVSSDRP